MKGELAVVFPGQGSQAAGMGGALAARWPSARKRFEEASAALGWDLLALCVNGPEEKLARTECAQPALYTAGFATWEVLAGEGIRPAMFSGHSLGEYTALAAAGSFPFAEGLRLVKARCAAMARAAEANPGGMTAVLGAAPEALAAWLKEAGGKGPVVAANENAPGQVVVSGAVPALEVVERLAKEAGVRAIRLKVAGAFHSPLMKDAAGEMRKVLGGVKLADPAVPVVGNTEGQVIRGEDGVRDELEAQLSSPVRWERCITAVKSKGIGTLVESGPGKVLCGLIRRIDRDLEVHNTNDIPDIEETLGSVKGGGHGSSG